MRHHDHDLDDIHYDNRTHVDYPTRHHHEYHHADFVTIDDPAGDDIDNYVVAYLHDHGHDDLADALDNLIQSVAATHRTPRTP